MDQRTEDSSATGKLTDRLLRLRIDAAGNESFQVRAARIDNTQRRIARLGKTGRAFNDLLQQIVQRHRRAQGHARASITRRKRSAYDRADASGITSSALVTTSTKPKPRIRRGADAQPRRAEQAFSQRACQTQESS